MNITHLSDDSIFALWRTSKAELSALGRELQRRIASTIIAPTDPINPLIEEESEFFDDTPISESPEAEEERNRK